LSQHMYILKTFAGTNTQRLLDWTGLETTRLGTPVYIYIYLEHIDSEISAGFAVYNYTTAHSFVDVGYRVR
jgi:hypothetical protein